MKNRSDIETLFREGGQRLTVQPSSQTWDRLERRLGHQKQQGKIVLMRWLAAAAAIFLVVFGLYLWNDTSQADFAVEANPMPKFLEELTGTGDCNPYCLLLKSRNELPAYYANPVRNEVQ